MTGKVMSGAKPAELPIQLPTNLELVVNAKRPKPWHLIDDVRAFARR
jgi:hypothetical protein